MAAGAAAAGKTRKGRTAPTVQPFTNFINSSASDDNSTRLRLQFLTTQIGLTVGHATLVAALAWGGHNG